MDDDKRRWCEDCRMYEVENVPVSEQPCGCLLCIGCVRNHEMTRERRGDGHAND